MIWPVYVINMAANTTRMTRVADELERLDIPFTRFEAVDGRALSPDERARVYDPAANLRRARHPMVGPEIGCYLSHIAIWNKIASSDAPGGIILEDDFSAATDLGAVLAALASDRADWDIAKLFSARVNQQVFDRRPLVAGRDIAVPYKVPNTTLGYAIRRDAAGRLAAGSLPMSRPIDEDHKHFWEFDLKIMLVTPSPLSFGEQSAETGTITAARRRTEKQKSGGVLRRIIALVRFRLNYLAKLHWHRLLGRAGK
ncbi:glycosyltransferase family 25 protein [Pseudorhodobacter ferrugineus]|uniref:glycosyltransferase family 25 protein n=1 Tax=Pseudorhodobacter ferrugineus TaxID=77008 RepID=UPI0003B5EDFB|nr:glycosyltransferase family 25 protein [Pseudorhodobacter ferrugineus]